MSDQINEGSSASSTFVTSHRDPSPGPSQENANKEAPNWRQYEQHLGRLAVDITSAEQALKDLLGSKPSGSVGEIAVNREAYRRCRREREQYRHDSTVYQRQWEETKRTLAAKRQEISHLEENNLYFKNEQKLADQLRRYETSYDNKQFTNIREETAIVQQIDKLRRNQKQLKKWKALCDERDAMEAEMKTLWNQRKECHQNLRETRQNEQTYKTKYREGVQSVHAKKRELSDLFNRKRRLIEEYNEKKHQWSSWQRSQPKVTGNRRQGPPHGPKSRRKATGAGLRHSTCEGSDSESEGGSEFELFMKEKRSCRNLISYLQRMVPTSSTLFLTPSTGSCDSEHASNSPSTHVALSNASSLAEEQTVLGDAYGSLVVLKKDSGDEYYCPVSTCAEPHSRRKGTKKEKPRKATMAISYDPQTLSLFDFVGVKAPMTLSDVPTAIENLKEQLKCYEDQTRMPPDGSLASYWFDTFGIRYHTDRMVSSESEMTTDSARFSYVTPSDVDMDDSNSCTGITSPLERGSIASLQLSPPPPSLNFTTGTGEPSGTVETPLAMAEMGANPFTALLESKAGITEQASVPSAMKVSDDERRDAAAGFSRVPTYDEGFADLGTEAMSKESSTGDAVTGEKGVDPVEVRKRLGNLGLEGE